MFGFNKVVAGVDIDSNTPDSWGCQGSSCLCPSAEHVITGNLNVIPYARVRNIVSEGPKYRFPSDVDFPVCRRGIAASFGDFSNCWCKRKNVEPDALKEWKIDILRVIGARVLFCSRGAQLLPPGPGSSFCRLELGVRGFRVGCVLVAADEAANNVIVVWPLCCVGTLKCDLVGTDAYGLRPYLAGAGCQWVWLSCSPAFRCRGWGGSGQISCVVLVALTPWEAL